MSKEALPGTTENWRQIAETGDRIIKGQAARIRDLEIALAALLRHSFAEERQECGIGQSEVWRVAKEVLHGKR